MRLNHLVCFAIAGAFAMHATTGFGQSTSSSNGEFRYYYLEDADIEQPSTIAKVATNTKPKGEPGMLQSPQQYDKGSDFKGGSGCGCGNAKGSGCGCGAAKGSGCGCGATDGCDSGCSSGCCQRMNIKFGLLYLTRDNPNDVPVIQRAGVPIFRANQFDFDYEPGFELEVNRRLDSCTNLNVRYFQVDGFEDVAAVPYLAPDVLATAPPGIGIPGGPSTAFLQYRSELHSFEINRERRVSDQTTFSLGARYIEVDDTLRAAAPGFAAEINADNHLYGFQLGLNRSLRSRGQLELSGYSKMGLYTNFADQSATVPGLITGTSDGALTFVGEVGLVSDLRLNNRLSFVTDVRLLYLDGLALAADQLPLINGATGAVGRLDMSEVFYYGVFGGLQWAW